MIFVECYADKTLVQFLGYTRDVIKHVGGKGRVVANVWKNEDSVGLIDQDPGSGQPSRMKEFSISKRIGSLNIKRHPGRKSVLVILHPRLEEWLVRAAKQAKLDIKEYGLPDNAAGLHAAVGTATNKAHEKLKGLLEALQGADSGYLNDLRTALG